MKITRKSTKHIYDPEADDSSESEETTANTTMDIEEDSLDDDLWEDWQKIMDLDRQQNESKMKIAATFNSKKTEFGQPIVIKGSSASSQMPKILHRSFKRKAYKIKNNILQNFVCHEVAKTPAEVIICKTIVPDETRETKINRMKHKLSAELIEESTCVNHSIARDRQNSFQSDDSIDINQFISNEKQEETLTSVSMPVEGNLPHFYSLRNKVICIIEPDCKFSFQGKLQIQVLYGALNVYGTTLTTDNTITPAEVYSSRDSSLVSLESTYFENDSRNITDIWQSLKSDDINERISNDFQKYINNLENGWVVLRLKNIENNMTKFLNAYCPHRLFPKLDDVSNYSWSDPKRAGVVLQANFYPENCGRQVIQFNAMEKTVDAILKSQKSNSDLKILIAGGKSVGKSSAARYAVNKLLGISESVVFLDLDVGQAEFTPPGCISLNIVKDPLLGPNFSHLKTPYFHLYIGGIDASMHLTNYIEGVNRLARLLADCEEIKGRPVVINTMGFCRGIGWDIICHAIQTLQPTDVIQIGSKKPKNNFDHLLTHQIINRQVPTWNNWLQKSSVNKYNLNHTFHTLDSHAETKTISGESWNIEPHQKREIVMLAYLSDTLKTKNLKDATKDYSLSINRIIPYEVAFSTVKLSLGRPLVSRVLSVMNGNIVALCGIDAAAGKESENAASAEHSGYPKVLIRAPLALCYGFGILRGVDMQNEKLYINTPLSAGELQHVNCLIGSTPVPSGLLLLNRPGLPYTGGECNLPTSRDARRGYARIRRHNDSQINI